MAKKRDIKDIKDIRKIFDVFYGFLFENPLMKPYFKNFDSDKIEKHKVQIVNFWNGILFLEEGYDGYPVETHRYINNLKKMSDKAFDHWLTSFDQAIDSHFEGPMANLAKEKSRVFAMIFKESIKI